MRLHTLPRRLLQSVGLCLFLASAQADPPKPAISIIIDDLGYHPDIAERLLHLPEPITFAILPHSPSGKSLAQIATASNREVILHLPMESRIGMNAGPGSLGVQMGADEFVRTLTENLDAIPNIVGVNNHMGSLLTSRRDAMGVVMRELADRGSLFFVDSRTSAATVAEDTARLFGIPSTRRDVFLDNQRDTAAINAQFDLLLAKSRQQGYAVAIGHPYAETLQILEKRLSGLQGFRVISVSQQIAERPYSSIPPIAKHP